MKKDGKSDISIFATVTLAVLIVVFALICYFFIIFFGNAGREPYAGAVLYEVYGYFQTGLYYIGHFPKDEDEVLRMFEIVKQKEPTMAKPHYRWKIKYRLIEEKDGDVIFLIIVDSTADIDFLTYKGSINTGLGRAKKDEKGKWHGTIEWFYKTGTAVEKF